MIELVAGLALFLGVHLLPSATGVKAGIVSRVGENRYKLMFTVISVTGLGLIIYGKGNAEFIHLWQPPAWGRHFTMSLMLPAFILLAASSLPGNFKRISAHPMMWGTFVWGIGHLFANGDLASTLLFGGFAGYAIISIISANLRGAKRQTRSRPVVKDIVVAAVGTGLYLLIFVLHPLLFGVAIVG